MNRNQRKDKGGSTRMHSFSCRNRSYLFDPDTLEIHEAGKNTIRILGPSSKDKTGLNGFDHDLDGYLLVITNRCNLRCDYCFAEGGGYRLEPGAAMSHETICRALDHLVKTSRKPEATIIFFGGEPLMEFDLIRSAVQYWENRYADQKKAVFGIVTNGTLLNRRVALYCREKGIRLLVSLDGTQAHHDAVRRYPDGTGSWHRIVQNLAGVQKIMEKPALSCSCTLTRNNMEIQHLFHEISALGFSGMDFQMENIFYNTSSLQVRDMKMLSAGLEDLFQQLSASGRPEQIRRIDLVHKFLNALERKEKRHYFCYTGRTRYAVTPEGNLYPCVFFAARQAFCMGNIRQGITRPDVQKEFFKTAVDKKKGCGTCFARYLCGGGCAFAAWTACGDISGAHPGLCVLYRRVASLCLEYAVLRDVSP